MSNKKMLTFYGLKWNPFLPDQPSEALWMSPRTHQFCWKIEQIAHEGGFVLLVSSGPGMGKSVTLRLLASRLSALPDVHVGVMEHPQSSVGDFYRELGHLFGVVLSASNRWGAFKSLREKWKSHLERTLYRPVLLIDESQLMQPAVFAELRVLASMNFDSRNALTVVFAGDHLLLEMLNDPMLKPLDSRIRVRFFLEPASHEELATLLRHSLEQAGNPQLMTPGLIKTVAEHSLGNHRSLMNVANELLMAGFVGERRQLDEKLYLETFSPPADRSRSKVDSKRRADR